MADARYKQMVVDANGSDIICSDAITGVKANWLRPSLEQAGYDPNNLPAPGAIDVIKAAGDAKRWRDIWAAGQGVGSALAKAGLGHARSEGLRVLPTCPFVAAYMREHPEEKDLLMPGVSV